jgi:DNA-binding LacI/PurR family transcriptional regulator
VRAMSEHSGWVVADQNASRVIISPTSAPKTNISDLTARRLPIIAVDMALPAASGSVLVDNEEAGAFAARHLINMRMQPDRAHHRTAR